MDSFFKYVSDAISSTHNVKVCKCKPCQRLRDSMSKDKNEKKIIRCECGFNWESQGENWGRKLSFFQRIFDLQMIPLGHVIYGFLYYLNEIGGFRYRTGCLSPEMLYAVQKISSKYDGIMAMEDMANKGDIDGLRQLCSVTLDSKMEVQVKDLYDVLIYARASQSRGMASYLSSGGAVDKSSRTFKVLSLFATYIYLSQGCGKNYMYNYECIEEFDFVSIWTYKYAADYHKLVHRNQSELAQVSLTSFGREIPRHHSRSSLDMLHQTGTSMPILIESPVNPSPSIMATSPRSSLSDSGVLYSNRRQSTPIHMPRSFHSGHVSSQASYSSEDLVVGSPSPANITGNMMPRSILGSPESRLFSPSRDGVCEKLELETLRRQRSMLDHQTREINSILDQSESRTGSIAVTGLSPSKLDDVTDDIDLANELIEKLGEM